MKPFIIFIALVVSGLVSANPNISLEEQKREALELKQTLNRIAKEAKTTYLKLKNEKQARPTAAQDQNFKDVLALLSTQLSPLHEDDNCRPNRPPGNGLEGVCWEGCVADNWPVSYCVDTCGVQTGPGQRQCWQACDEDNWPLSYCADKCTTTRGGGEAACWQKCDGDNWPVSYCVDNCGVKTPRGQRVCYDTCKADNWSDSYCMDNCVPDNN